MRVATVVFRFVLLVAVFSSFARAQVVVTDDANTSSFSPKSNYGTSIALIVCSGSNTYLKFSLANLGPGITSSNVSKATLVLYVDYVLTSGTMDVYQVGGSWSEGSITYNTAPVLGTKLFSAVSVTKTGFLSLDLTSSVQAWLSGTLVNNGIALVPSSGSPIFVSFDSKENIFTSHVADLSLVLVSAGSVGPQGPQGVQGPQGAVGPQGSTGATGPAGSNGTNGAAGPQGPGGSTGATGATGPMGPMGLLGPQGPAGTNGTNGTNGTGFNFRKLFDASATYVTNDVVTYNGSTYVATAANGLSNSNPDVNPAWTLMAQQGAIGPLGPIGLTGPAGAPGPFGPAGPQGPVGPQGPQGQSGGGSAGSLFASAFFGRALTGSAYTAAQIFPDQPITVTRITAGAETVGDSTCSAAVLRLTDGSKGEDVAIPGNQANTDSGTGILTFASGSTLQVKMQTGAVCRNPPSLVNLIVHYRPQISGDVDTCAGTQQSCSGFCESTTIDANNCGSCGKVCGFANGSASCAAGSCVLSGCTSPFSDCNHNPVDGCETNTAIDTNNCGFCGNACYFANGSGVCALGSCALSACNPGFGDCNHSPIDGCETNTTSDFNNCGACNNRCGVFSTACVNGVCN
jgi:Collagen triple helix repeat (20 copies)